MSDALGPMVYGENEGEVFLGPLDHHAQERVRDDPAEGWTRRSGASSTSSTRVARKIIEDKPRQDSRAMAKALLEFEDARFPTRSATSWPAKPPRPPKDPVAEHAAEPAPPTARQGCRRGPQPAPEAGRLARDLSGVLRCGGFPPAARPSAAHGRGERHGPTRFSDRRQVSSIPKLRLSTVRRPHRRWGRTSWISAGNPHGPGGPGPLRSKEELGIEFSPVLKAFERNIPVFGRYPPSGASCARLSKRGASMINDIEALEGRRARWMPWLTRIARCVPHAQRRATPRPCRKRAELSRCGP